MPFTLQQAVQSLQCEPPVKVAMRFSTRWWTTLQNHRGGVSRTDRPTRIVVYPSYGIDTDTATMIVSHTWTQDAPRNAAFVKGSVADKMLRDSTLAPAGSGAATGAGRKGKTPIHVLSPETQVYYSRLTTALLPPTK